MTRHGGRLKRPSEPGRCTWPCSESAAAAGVLLAHGRRRSPGRRERKTFAGEVLKALEKRRTALWDERIHKQINWELFDRGVEAFTWAALEEVGRAAKSRDLLNGAAHGDGLRPVRARRRPGPATARTTTRRPWSRSSPCARSWRSRSPRGCPVAAQGRAQGRPAARRWTASCRCRAGATSGPSRSSTASTCSRPACAPRSASRCSAPTWRPSTASARRSSRRSSRSTGART